MILRLLFAVCTLFLFLVFGLFVLLFLKLRLGVKNTFMDKESDMRSYKYHGDGKVIQGEYKIINETHKDREAD